MRLVPVGRADLARAWPVAEPLLARACARPGCDLALAELHATIERGEACLVLVLRNDRVAAAGVTQVRQHADRSLSAWILTLGGSGAGSWRPVIDAVADGARRAGCASLEFVGRRGWARLFPDFATAPDPVGFHFAKALR